MLGYVAYNCIVYVRLLSPTVKVRGLMFSAYITARTITRVRYTTLFDRSSQRTERRAGTIPCPRERGSSRTPPCKQGCPEVYPQPSKKISLETYWSHLVQRSVHFFPSPLACPLISCPCYVWLLAEHRQKSFRISEETEWILGRALKIWNYLSCQPT
jgi:hypothetical protein